MRPLQLTLFLIANVIFITQAGRHAHQLVYGTEASILEQFEKGHIDKERVRTQRQLSPLLQEYSEADRRISTLEKDHKAADRADVRQQNAELYETRDALRNEISEREIKDREMRDMRIYCCYASSLYALGILLYCRAIIWPGFALIVTAFSILEYWASPAIFGGGGAVEYHQLLVTKMVMTILAIGLLYSFWWILEFQRSRL